MKIKVILLFVVLAFGLILIGCSSSKQSSTPTTTPNLTTPTATTTEVKAESVKPSIINIKDITGKSQNQVETVLGKPVSTEEGKWRYYGTQEWILNCPTVNYPKGISIKFIEDVAARITITPQTPIKYENQKEALNAIGLIETSSYQKGQDSTFYSNVQGIYEFRIFQKENSDMVDYLYIVINEKYR